MKIKYCSITSIGHPCYDKIMEFIDHKDNDFIKLSSTHFKNSPKLQSWGYWVRKQVRGFSLNFGGL